MTGAPPFSRTVRVDALPADGQTITIEADAAERAALAALNHLPAIDSLTARFTLRRKGRDGAKVEGVVRAEVTQVCVVTAEPFPARVEEPIDIAFAPPARPVVARRGQELKEPKALEVELSDQDPPDEIVDGKIDLGALAAEFLALGLDPYPRKPGVEFAALASEGDAGSPFATLAESKAEAKPKSRPKRGSKD
ncbi:MAG: DUF177 domain-containing protein [Bradyrhizobium sp.]|nr:MAG: DUF177 domain-containing protein [Bradyrhizobium sp.]